MSKLLGDQKCIKEEKKIKINMNKNEYICNITSV